MLEGVFRRWTHNPGSLLKRIGGALKGVGGRPASLESELALSEGARKLVAARQVPLALRRLEWDVRELNGTQARRLKSILASPKDINSHPHGATNGINIWVNELKAKVNGAEPTTVAAWQQHHGPLMGELDKLQLRTNVMQLRYTGGRYEPNPWTPVINLPHAQAARTAYAHTPARPTQAEFEALANHAISLAERLNAVFKG